MEILAPAGGYEAVEAAVFNGADAVYLGQQKFNARQSAENFDETVLKKAVDFCHQRGVKVYQTLNTLVFDDEMEDLQETIQTACRLQVDALIVQDFGVLSMVRKICPQFRVHGSTQMSVHTVEGARLMKQLGIKRVVLAREMTLEEIRQIIEQVDIEVEVFAHGALCMCVSGQCYMSAAIGGRSGNRGSCAGTCRLPFSVEKNPSGERYDLSLKDLCAAGQFEKLEQIGVTSLKIEGRMKRPEYVAAASKAYHGLNLGEKPDFNQLRSVFSRSGFTDGYLTNRIQGDMFGFRSKEDVTAATPQVLAQLRETYHKEEPRFGARMEFSMKRGQPAKLTVKENGNQVSIEGEIPEEARNKPTTREMAEESLGKLGGTPYYLASFTAQMEDGLILPKSKLNEMRRQAVEQLMELRCREPHWEYTSVEIETLRSRMPRQMKLRARFRTAEQITTQMLEQLEACYLPADEVKKDLSRLLDYREKIIIEPDRILFGREEAQTELLKELKAAGFSRLWVSNPAHISIGNRLGFTLSGSSFLNIANTLSAECYAQLGLKETMLSVELTVGRIGQISPQPEMPLGMMVYGRLPLMVVRNCPVKRYRSCGECRSQSSLTDRLGNEFPVVCCQRRYSEVLNCTPMELSDRLNEFSRMDFGVLYFTTETAKQCEEILRRYRIGEKPEGNYTRGLYYRGVR